MCAHCVRFIVKTIYYGIRLTFQKSWQYQHKTNRLILTVVVVRPTWNNININIYYCGGGVDITDNNINTNNNNNWSTVNKFKDKKSASVSRCCCVESICLYWLVLFYGENKEKSILYPHTTTINIIFLSTELSVMNVLVRCI